MCLAPKVITFLSKIEVNHVVSKLLLTFGGMLRLRAPTTGEGLAWFLHSRRTLFFFLITILSRRQLQNIENVKLVSIL